MGCLKTAHRPMGVQRRFFSKICGLLCLASISTDMRPCTDGRRLVAQSLAFIAAMLSAILPPVIQTPITTQLQHDLELRSPASPAFRSWASSVDSDRPPSYITAHLFNITNPHEILQGAKPRLKELPPLTYLRQQGRYGRLEVAFVHRANARQPPTAGRQARH